jgi:hypothetical protein
MAPVEMSDKVRGSALGRLTSIRWQQLGLPAGEVVTARAATREVHYVINGDRAHGGPTVDARDAEGSSP